MLKPLNGSLIYNKVLNTYDSFLILPCFYPVSSPVSSCWHFNTLATSFSHFVFKINGVQVGGGVNLTIFLKHMLCMLF